MRKKKIVWILVAVLAVTLAGLWIWRSRELDNRSTHALTMADVQHKLGQSLPVGSSRTAVESYLDSQLIPHSYFDGQKFPNERRVELALIRNASRSLLVRRDIQIQFRFDDSDQLQGYSLQEVFTGPQVEI